MVLLLTIAQPQPIMDLNGEPAETILVKKIELGSRKTDEEPFSTTLKGLTKGTTYYYRAYSNRSGSDNEGEIKSFKAGDKSTNVPYVITRDYDYEEDSNEATVYGQVSSRGGSEIIEYGFKWGTSSGSLTRTKTIRGDIAEGRTFSADLTKLASDATYYFQAYAENDNGIGYGAIKEFTIDEYDSGDRPTVNTQTAKVSGNSVTLYGYLNDRGDTSITSYGFYFGKDSDPITRYEVGEYIMDDESFEYTIKNLELGTTYYYKAYARNSAGEEEGKILNIRAGSNVTMVLTTQVNNLGGGGATLLGTIDSGGNSDLTAYGFYWGILNGAETEVKLGSSISVGTTFSYYLTGLETGKTYVARAYARSGNNTYLGNQVTINPSAGGTPIVSGSPVVNIIAPASGTSVSKGAPVAVNATASGSSPIIAMGLYVNGTQKARVDAASINYSVDTSALPAGTNVIRVTGWDGVKAGERVITISVVSGNGTTTPVIPGGSAPTVNIENPSNFEIIKRGNVVEIRASSTPGSKPIEAMALYLYDKRLLRTSGNGFSYFWDTSTVAPGVYEIKVNAWDGSVAGEKIVKVTIQQ